ncbi:hypothetical protein [Paenibacillus polymyxa]|nr:hypothetical protein [Paenibacillus polymyxa]MDN4090957.1 hypothetical protein [Paenibacillus polymyxa]
MWLNILGELCAVITFVLGIKMHGRQRFVACGIAFLALSANTFGIYTSLL